MVTFNNFIYLFEIWDLPAFFILADYYFIWAKKIFYLSRKILYCIWAEIKYIKKMDFGSFTCMVLHQFKQNLKHIKNMKWNDSGPLFICLQLSARTTTHIEGGNLNVT